MENGETILPIKEIPWPNSTFYKPLLVNNALLSLILPIKWLNCNATTLIYKHTYSLDKYLIFALIR